jgi:stage II sporulation protein R
MKSMENRKGKENMISPRQFQRTMIIELFCGTSLILPALLVRLSGKNGLASLLLGSAMACVLAVYYLWIAEKWKAGYTSQVMDRYGKIGSSVYVVLYCVRFFLRGLFLMVLFTALIQEVLLPGQARWMILLPILVLAYYAGRKGQIARARTLELLFFYIFVPLLVVVFLAFFRMDTENLPLMLGNGTLSFRQNLYGAYGVLMTYTALEFLLFLYPKIEKGNLAAKSSSVVKSSWSGNRKRLESTKIKKQKGRLIVWPVLAVIFLNLLIFIGTVGMFGTVRTGKKLWSALWLMQSVKLPGHFLERLDILFLAVWIFGIFALFSGYYFYSSQLVQGWCKKWEKQRREGLYPVLFFGGIFLGTLWLENPETILSVFGNYLMWVDFPLAVILPLLVRSREKSTKKMRKKRGRLFLTLFLLVFCLSGCQSRVDLEDRNYVMTLGVDAGEKDAGENDIGGNDIGGNGAEKNDAGVQKAFCITYETADFDQPTGEGEGGDAQQGTWVSYEADSLLEAENLDEKSDEKQLDFGHLKAILISETVKENPDLWNQLIEELSEKTNLSGNVLVFFTKEKTGDFIAAGQNQGTSLGDYLEKMVENHRSKESRNWMLSTLLRNEAEGEKIRIPTLQLEEEQIILECGTVSQTSQQEIANQVLRFHLRANSDERKDQELKGKVKIQVVEYLQSLLAGCSSKEACEKTIESHLTEIEETAKAVCASEENPMAVHAYLTRENFPKRQYGDMVFPSGVYDALRVDLGEGEGNNWWCMMYPSLCMVDGVVEKVPEESKEILKENLSEETYASLFSDKEAVISEDVEENSTKKITFHVKWKAIEKLKQWFSTAD